MFKCGGKTPQTRAGAWKPLFEQHSGESGHRRAANSDDVDVFYLSHSMTAGSRISSVPLACASRRVRTPRGKVSMGRAVWPIGAPYTMGMPRGLRIRLQISRK